MSRLIYAGHVTRYAKARIVAGIGGAALPVCRTCPTAWGWKSPV